MTAAADAERRVDDAFAAVPRAPFLPLRLRHRAGDDAPLPIGHGATCSQPRTVRDMLVLLDARPGHRVLDVGSGSGWTTALLSHLVSPGGAVVGVEIEPELAETSRTALAGRELSAPDVVVHVARPHVLGWPDDAPYDRILVSAQARVEIPPALLDQLAPTAVLVAPVRGALEVVRQADGVRDVTRHGAYRFVPLRD